jgi:hypothetical protein
MKFLVKEKRKEKCFSLVYEEKGRSFNIAPFQKNIGFTSLSINCLQLEIDYDKRIVYVWGYEPLMKYEEINKFPESYEHKDLIALTDRKLIPGVSIGLDKNKEWPTYINKKMGWVCVGDPTIEDRRLIGFAPDCVAALDKDSEMVAIWLHPKKLPSHLFENSID